MNSRTFVAVILAIIFCAGPALADTPKSQEWSDIMPIQGIWSKIYFDYQQVTPGDTGRFHCINDWMALREDGCVNGGLVCDTSQFERVCFPPRTGACEVNLFQFTIGTTEYTIKVYKDSATITPDTIPGFEGKFSWNPSPNSPGDVLEHTIWEFSFPIHPTIMVNFTGHDPAVPTDTVWNPPPPTIITNLPSAFTHYGDGVFADWDSAATPVCNPTGRCYIPDSLLPKDPHIPPLTIILHEGGGVTVIPLGQGQIPTLSEWGMIIFVVLLAGWMTFVVVRRWRASHATGV